MKIVHHENCKNCFDLEDCIGRIQEILSEQFGANIDECIYEDQKIHH